MSDHFHAIVDRGELLDWVETYKSIVDEARIEVRDTELWGRPVDPANVAMVEQTFAARAFESFDSSGDFRLGVNLNRLEDYVDAGDADLVNIEYSPETAMLDLTCGSVDVEMALIDPDSIRKPGTINDGIAEGMVADVTVEAGAFAHAIDVADMVGDHVYIEANADGDPPLRVYSEGDTDSVSVGFDSSVKEGSEVTGDGESCFSIDYLEELAGAVDATADLRIRIGDEWPMLLTYEAAAGARDVRMLCAPRIRSD